MSRRRERWRGRSPVVPLADSPRTMDRPDVADTPALRRGRAIATRDQAVPLRQPTLREQFAGFAGGYMEFGDSFRPSRREESVLRRSELRFPDPRLHAARRTRIELLAGGHPSGRSLRVQADIAGRDRPS